MNAADCLELCTDGVSHALDRLDIGEKALGIAALDRAFRCVGQAFTICVVRAGVTKGEWARPPQLRSQYARLQNHLRMQCDAEQTADRTTTKAQR